MIPIRWLKFRRLKFFGILALASLFACSAPQNSSATDEADNIRSIVDASILPLMAEHDLPGMSVAVTINGRAHFFNYGVASREENTPVTESTLFEVGSVSKTFTATLATYAQALGKLSLDDNPGLYIPQLKDTAIDQANLLHLGTYTPGGLPLQFPASVSDESQMIPYFQQWQADAAPGVQRRYSNPSLGLFGRIAGGALAGDFIQAMEAQLLPELGLGDTYIRVPHDAMARYAWGYNVANEPIRVNPGVFDAEAYGIKSTAADLLRYVQKNIDPSGLSAPMQSAIAGTHLGYFEVGAMVQGLGWEQYPYPVALEQLLEGNSGTMIFEANAATPLTPPREPSRSVLFNKTGSTSGFGAYVAFVPEKKIGIVMLANKSYLISARLEAAHAILERIAP